MKLANDPEIEKFLSDFNAFVDEHMPTAEEASERPRSCSHMPDWARRWQRTLFEGGWLLPGNPPEYGGRNATLPQMLAHQEELSRRGIYHSFNPQGVGIIAASILTFGTEEQKKKWAVPMDHEAFSASWFERYSWSFPGTIAGGTSEIHRNIIAERILGLPR